MHSGVLTYIPLFSALFTLGLGVVIFLRYLKSRKELELVLALFCGSITIWLFGTFMVFISISDSMAIFWDRFVYSGVIFIPVLMHHFSVVFTRAKNQRKCLPVAYVISFVFLILSQTNLFVGDLYRYQWGSHTKAYFFHHVFIVLFFLYTSVFFVNISRYYRSGLDSITKNRTKYVMLAFLTLIIIGAPASLFQPMAFQFHPFLLYLGYCL